MVEVKVYYRPWWFLRYKKAIKGSFPEKFEELTAKQLIGVAKVLKGMIPEISFLHTMTGIRKRILRRLDAFERFKLLQLFDAFNEPRPFHEFIIKNLLKGDKVLLAPKPKLKGMTFGQFIFADTYFGSYQESNSADDLHRFVTSMYLPEGLKFDEKLIDENCHLLKDVDPVTLEAIAINYLLIREWLGLAYPLIFVKEDEESRKQHEAVGSNEESKKREKKKKAFDPTGWIKVFDGLVGDDIVNQDKYADMPLHNVFRYMTNRIKENMKRRRKK